MTDSSKTAPRHPAPPDKPADRSTRSSLERDLADREASIHQRLDDLEGEITSAPAAITSSIIKHPLLGLAGAVATGMAVGWLVTRKRRPDVAPFHQQLIEQYIHAVGDDVRHRIHRGSEPEQAVQEAMQDRTPVIVYAPEHRQPHESRGFWSEVGDIVLKTALGFAVKVAIDAATATIDVEDLAQMIVAEEEQAKSEPTAHGGDGAAGVDRTAGLP